MQLGITVPREGKYIFVIQYHSTLVDKIQNIDVDVETTGDRTSGKASFQVCPYRSVVLNCFRQFLSVRTKFSFIVEPATFQFPVSSSGH